VGTALYVVVTGPPGSGKSTVAQELARALGLPLLAKDAIKETLFESLSVVDVEASRRLGGAAIEVAFAVAAASPIGAVLEGNFHRTPARPAMAALRGCVVEVFCRCTRATARARYRARASTRAPGHFDAARTDDDIWHAEVSEPVAGGWPVVELGTEEPVDVARLTAAIKDVASR
jgi:predicted kinase